MPENQGKLPGPGDSAWQSGSGYPASRAVQLALWVRGHLLVSDTEVLEYVGEAEHQEGDGYWAQFPTLADAVADFKEYLVATREVDDVPA